MRKTKTLFGLLLIIIALVLGLPYLMERPAPVKIRPEPVRVRLFVHETGKIVSLPLEDYVTGVVAAEMPASFPVEALKAQAVAARTYIVRRLTAGGVANNAHPGSDISDDHRDGQAWISRAEMKKRWGFFGYYEYYFKIRRAVDETRGLVLTWQGALIDPAYFASCGGLGTESAATVWQSDEPYLKRVDCPYDADPQPVRKVTLPVEQVDRSLGVHLGAVPVIPGAGVRKVSPPAPFAVIARTPAGRALTVSMGGRTFPATTVRDRLGLRSTAFTMQLKGDRVEITTRGYGHAVGMCQYGAKGYALQGYNFEQILKHYYTGVDIIKM
ncbi:stage II sporulation protein D [Desulfotomaculum copahuensis]|uniref:Stage II sporulation protein D n=1 Tax=Desulfotomaculum copahuensis TaxID=1838280 RepID=A0A1B7LBE8_9FIRM|nr:stage II sporulation protein D [Desulfotomaculum copahuensis]OAT79788.1 stage II sporulation protein D [Desulfotomaculum copahuensis]